MATRQQVPWGVSPFSFPAWYNACNMYYFATNFLGMLLCYYNTRAVFFRKDVNLPMLGNMIFATITWGLLVRTKKWFKSGNSRSQVEASVRGVPGREGCGLSPFATQP